MKIDKIRIDLIIVGTMLILSMIPTTMAATGLPAQNEKTIVLRLDDIQGYAWDNISMKLINTVLNNNMNITLGVIPVSGIDNDKIIKNYLINISKDPRVEIAQHGYKHSPHEYLYVSQNQADKITKLGYQFIIQNIGVRPITFIPPYNEYNHNTEKALSKLGFKIISAGQNEYKTENRLKIIGYNTATSLDQKNLVPVDQILNDCKISLNKRNICIIMIHPEDYVAKNNKDMNSRYQEFVKLLDELKTLNTTFATFSQIN